MHLNEFKTIEITHNMFSDHNRIKTEIKNKKTAGIFQHIWKLNNTLQNNTWSKEKVSKESKKDFELEQNETILSKFGECS